MPAKCRVKITQLAEKDTEEIWAYIAADNPDRASTFISELERQFAALEQSPQRCPLVPENEMLGTEFRHLIYGKYRTIFRISGKTAYILRIIHGARLLDSSMFETKV